MINKEQSFERYPMGRALTGCYQLGHYLAKLFACLPFVADAAG